MEKFKLQECGLTPLSSSEGVNINGGIAWAPWALGALAASLMNNFGDIRRGLSDGWNGTPNP